jgi:hypothetical protein
MQHSIAGFQAQRAAASPSSNESSMLMRGHYYETFGAEKSLFSRFVCMHRLGIGISR